MALSTYLSVRRTPCLSCRTPGGARASAEACRRRCKSKRTHNTTQRGVRSRRQHQGGDHSYQRRAGVTINYGRRSEKLERGQEGGKADDTVDQSADEQRQYRTTYSKKETWMLTQTGFYYVRRVRVSQKLQYMKASHISCVPVIISLVTLFLIGKSTRAAIEAWSCTIFWRKKIWRCTIFWRK